MQELVKIDFAQKARKQILLQRSTKLAHKFPATKSQLNILFFTKKIIQKLLRTKQINISKFKSIKANKYIFQKFDIKICDVNKIGINQHQVEKYYQLKHERKKIPKKISNKFEEFKNKHDWASLHACGCPVTSLN